MEIVVLESLVAENLVVPFAEKISFYDFLWIIDLDFTMLYSDFSKSEGVTMVSTCCRARFGNSSRRKLGDQGVLHEPFGFQWRCLQNKVKSRIWFLVMFPAEPESRSLDVAFRNNLLSGTKGSRGSRGLAWSSTPTRC